jgi:SAM-dependent methyltransferase
MVEPEDVCAVCGARATFSPIKPGYSLRETRCSVCRAARRTRDVARTLARLAAGPDARHLSSALPCLARARLFEAQATGPLHDQLAALPGYVCSEYIPESVAAGGVSTDGVRCEDLEHLSFADAAFDYVITQDVLEHVADPWQAFDEIWRVLAPGGRHVFTVPVHEGHVTTTRVRVDAGGRHDLLPPVHHGDPLRQGGSLVMTDFGDDLSAHLTDRGQPTRVAIHVPFYTPSEMPGIIAGDIHARYEDAYRRGEKASFLRYNSLVLITEKPA